MQSRNGGLALTRHPAFYAKDSTKPLHLEDRLSDFARVKLLSSETFSLHDLMTVGAFGAAVSHLQVAKKIAEGEAPYGIVLEDDVLLPDNFSETLQEKFSQLPTGWDIWLLGCRVQDSREWQPESLYPTPYRYPHLKKNKIVRVDRARYQEVMCFFGAYAYVISKKAAQHLVETSFPLEVALELMIANKAQLGQLRIIVDKTVNVGVIRSAFGSSTIAGLSLNPSKFMPRLFGSEAEGWKWLFSWTFVILLVVLFYFLVWKQWLPSRAPRQLKTVGEGDPPV